MTLRSHKLQLDIEVVNRVCLIPFFFLLSGCMPLQSGVLGRDNLANRGPVVVSKSNPYIASNMLLSKEIELNPTLKGFLKIKGNPEALEVTKSYFSPYLMYFYYPSQKEQYILEESSGDWVIRGPEILAADSISSLSNMPLDAISKTKPEVEPKSIDLEDISAPSTEQPLVSEAPPTTKKETTAIADDVDGDILHLVKYKGETLRLIAGWYTGQPDNAARIARINGFKDANAIILDQKIRIPRYLVTKDTPLKKDDVEFYLKR